MEQKTSALRAVARASLPVAVASILIQACGGGGGDDAVAQQSLPQNYDEVEGVWEGQVKLRDCSSGTTFREMRVLNMFGRGGSVLDTNEMPTTTRGPGFGQWERLGERKYSVWQRFFEYDASGQRSGTRMVRRNLVLAADGQSLTSQVQFSFYNRQDVLVQSGCGEESSKRVS